MWSLITTNLSLLSFVPQDSSLNKQEISSLVHKPATHVKICDEMIYFLLSNIDKETAQQFFEHCWPIYDRIQSREFKTNAFKMMELLRKNGILPMDCLLRKSFLEECRGERFEKILLHLTWILLSSKRVSGLTEENLDIPMIQLKIVDIEQRFQDKMTQRLELKNSYKDMNAFLINKRVELEAKLDELQGQIQMSSDNRQLRVQEQSNIVSNIKSTWKEIQTTLIHLNQECENGLKQFLSESNKPMIRLDGKLIPLKIPIEYSHTFEEFMKKEKIEPYSHGKLDLTSLLKLYLQSLLIIKSDLQDGLTVLDQHSCQYIQSTTNSTLENANTLFDLQKQEIDVQLAKLQLQIQESKLYIKPTCQEDLQPTHTPLETLQIPQHSKSHSMTSLDSVIRENLSQKAQERMMKITMKESKTPIQERAHTNPLTDKVKKELSIKIAQELRNKQKQTPSPIPTKHVQNQNKTPKTSYSQIIKYGLNTSPMAFDSPCCILKDSQELFVDLFDENMSFMAE